MNTIGKFDVKIVSAPKGAYPFQPFVNITLRNWAKGDDGAVCISADLMTDNEIDQHIAALKQDLDAVAARAKSALTKAHAARRSPTGPQGKA